MAFNITQYQQIAEKWAANNPREVGRYGPKMIQLVTEDCFQQGLPTLISFGISFRRLQASGKLKRVDGHDEKWDQQQDYLIAKTNLDKVVAEVYSQPITVEFEEYCASLSQRELSRLHYGEDNDAVNEFAIKYRRLAKERGYRIPDRFVDQGQAVPVASNSGGGFSLTIGQYNSMTAEQVKVGLRRPDFREAVYKLIASGELR